MVVSSPTKLNVEGSNITNFTSEPINAGTFIQGTDNTALNQQTIGFSNNNNLLFGHNTNDLNVPLSRKVARASFMAYTKTKQLQHVSQECAVIVLKYLQLHLRASISTCFWPWSVSGDVLETIPGG